MNLFLIHNIKSTLWLHILRDFFFLVHPVQKLWEKLIFADERNQEMPPKIMPIWHIGYFELKAVEKQ